MSRDGFPVADIDVGLLSDPKVAALARRLRRAQRVAAALLLYQATVLASWRAGRRVSLVDALPAWWLEPWEELARSLIDVELLDEGGLIPDHAWAAWFGPALERRLAIRRAAIYGGLVRSGRSSEDANAEADRRIDAERVRLGFPSRLSPKPEPGTPSLEAEPRLSPKGEPEPSASDRSDRSDRPTGRRDVVVSDRAPQSNGDAADSRADPIGPWDARVEAMRQRGVLGRVAGR